MKAYFNFAFVLAMLLFIGCSVEPLEDSSLDERQLTTETTKNQPFVIQGYGEFIVIPGPAKDNIDCEGYTILETEGISSEQTLGRFATTTRVCTDRNEFYAIRGVHRFPNGEELYFHSVTEVENGAGKEIVCVFDGGTGRFEGATGMVTLIEETIFHDAKEGTYTNHGVGTITMGK